MSERSVSERAVDVLEALWEAADVKEMSKGRLYGIWDEYLGRVRSALRAKDLRGFVELMARKWVGGAVPASVSALVEDADGEVYRELRACPAVIVAELRARRDERKQAGKVPA